MKYMIIGSLLFLAACVSVISNLPQLTEYTQEYQLKADTEIGSGMCPTLNEMMIDYGKLRDTIRVGNQ